MTFAVESFLICLDMQLYFFFLQAAAMYLQDRIEGLRKDIDKHGKVKTKKGQQAPPASKVSPLQSFLSSLSLPFLPCHSPLSPLSFFPLFLSSLFFLPFLFFPFPSSLLCTAFISA